MNTSSANLTSAEYLQTDFTWLILIATTLTVILILSAFIAGYLDHKKALKDKQESTLMQHTTIPLIAVALCGAVSFVIAGTLTSYMNSSNLMQNVETAYGAETVLTLNNQMPATPPPAVEGTVGEIAYNGKNYNVIITHNPDTYEPTIVSYEDGNEIPELEQAKSERMR